MLLQACIDEFAAAARGLAREPAFAALAVGVLSLGLGAVVFMYGVVDATLLRRPPYPAAEQIYVIHGRDPQGGELKDTVGAHDYIALREAGAPFAAMGAVYNGTVYLTGNGAAERLEGAFVTAGVFDVVRVPAALGRVLGPGDEGPAAAPAVVLGDWLWRERFGADPDVLGRTVRLNGRDAAVVGVMPPGFAFPLNQQLWLPSRQDPARVTAPEHAVDVMVYVRLADGVSADEAQQAIAPVAKRRMAESPAEFTRSGFELLTPGASWIGETGRQLLWALFAAVGVVLLIACANVSNLLLSRAAWRMRETGVRSALGATRTRLVLNVLAESALLSLSAAGLGLLLAALGLDAIAILLVESVETHPSWLEFGISVPVVLAAFAAAFAALLLAGLPAALRATRPALDAMLRDGGRGGTGRAVGRLAWSLVVAEVALAAAVLGGAALMTRTVLLVTHADLGVKTGELMTARVGLPTAAYLDRGYSEAADRPRLAGFAARYVERLEAQPEVDSGGLMLMLPGHGLKRGSFAAEGVEYASREAMPQAGGMSVSPSVFETLRIEPVAGRLLDATDTADSELVVVINETFAKVAWPGQSPLGRRARWDAPDEPWRTVVGVVPDAIQTVERGRPEPMFYVPIDQVPQRFFHVVVRGEGGPEALAAAMQRALEETDPELALYWVRTFEESLALRTAGFRVIGGMFAVFGAIALVLAAAGLYGVLRFHVGQRTRELGLRRALGAGDGRILGLLMRTTGTQVGLGLALGLAAVPLMEEILDRVLTWLSPGSAWVYLGVLAVMLVVAAAAVARPTWVALRIDPAAALRHE